MKKKIDKQIEVALIECHILLNDCIKFENIENKELICKNLNMLKDYRDILPEEIYSQIEQFIKETIFPIVYDTDYFSFLKREEYGSYNEEGHFVINSERSLEMMIFLMYEHTLELSKKLTEFASEYLHFNYGC